jgi:uncharacterized protein YaaN involved in tellurite resistance
MSTPQTQEQMLASLATPQTFELPKPEVVQPVAVEKAKDLVPLSAEARSKVQEQVDAFVHGLLTEDVTSQNFKAKLDAAFRLGRSQIADTAKLTNSFLKRNFVGMEDSPAWKAIADIRATMDDLNPAKEGDLLAPERILGFIPGGSKLKTYLRKFQSAETHLNDILGDLRKAQEQSQRDLLEIGSVEDKLVEQMRKLQEAIDFADALDGQVAQKVETLKAADPMRAKALEQEVLFYVRQNLGDMLGTKALAVNGYLAMGVLKQTGRNVVIGCDRVATNGMMALTIAQTVAIATANQVKTMEMLDGVKGQIENLTVQTSEMLGNHVQKVTEFSRNPLLGVETLQRAFDSTFKAIESMDTFRSEAIVTMGQNVAAMKKLVEQGETYMNRAQAAAGALDSPALPQGPVQL